MPEPCVDTLDPQPLQAFIDDLEAAGWAREDAAARWRGPLPDGLKPFTTSTTIRLTLRDGWPYVPPHLEVEGIDAWHADRDHLCLWQEDDNTRSWTSLAGILERIDEWTHHAAKGFDTIAGAALDPHLYFVPSSPEQLIGLDVGELVGNDHQDGQHGFLHLRPGPEVQEIHTGKPRPSDEAIPVGRWFLRSNEGSPPRDLPSFESRLTAKQRQLYENDVARGRGGPFVLIWPNPHGYAALVVHVDPTGGQRVGTALTPVAISIEDRLRRAGPDANALRSKRAVIFGVGAIGSHLSSILSRSGVGHLRLVDNDTLHPAGLVRHAGLGVTLKPHLMKSMLSHFPWTEVEPATATWAPANLGVLLDHANIAIDATGLSPFTELLGRVALKAQVPMISVALYRGGSIARVRRQTSLDTPIVDRWNHWRYPTIPPGSNESEYVGVEIGCAAPIHNAPPVAVYAAATLATRVVIDELTGRRHLPDEQVEVLDPIEAPFHRRGPLEPRPPEILITDEARARLLAAARQLSPAETGGILLGTHSEAGQPIITSAVEIPPDTPSRSQYRVPAGATHRVVDDARAEDPTIGYLGEWHSHPSNQGASSTDRATMRSLSPDAGPAPVLLIARPVSEDQFEIDSHIWSNSQLHTVGLQAVGPVQTGDAP